MLVAILLSHSTYDDSTVAVLRESAGELRRVGLGRFPAPQRQVLTLPLSLAPRRSRRERYKAL
jgi:hypothetical protein